MENTPLHIKAMGPRAEIIWRALEDAETVQLELRSREDLGVEVGADVLYLVAEVEPVIEIPPENEHQPLLPAVAS